MTTITPTEVQVTAGGGRLLHVEHGLLFLPDAGAGWEDLRAALEDPEAAGQGVAPIAQVLAARGLDAPALVHISWVPRLSVLVFGDIELRTDHPAVPMLTGRGSQTWVEHSVPMVGDAVELTVDPPDASGTDTDLRAGVVPAGGFRLRVTVATPVRASSAEEPPVLEAAPAAPAAAEPSAAEPSAPEPPAAEPASAASASPAPVTPLDTPAAAPPRSTWQPPPPLSDDPDAALGAIRAAAVTEQIDATGTSDRHAGPGAPAAGSGPPPPPVAGAPTDAHQPPVPGPDEQQAVDGDPRDAADAAGPDAARATESDAADAADAADAGRPLVDAIVCPDGHANPVGRGACRSCDALLPPDAQRQTRPRPTLGTLVFDDGTELAVDDDLVLGRRPPQDGRTAHVIESDRVSRHHAEVLLRGWEVLINDPGSRNGTYVVAAGAADPVRVDAGVPVRIEPGTKVYLGTRSFVFEDRAP